MRDLPSLLISGTRKGIGRALAEHYLDRGFRVVGCSRRPSELQREGYEHHCLDVGGFQVDLDMAFVVWAKCGFCFVRCEPTADRSSFTDS